MLETLFRSEFKYVSQRRNRSMGIYEKLELGGASPKPPSPRPKPSQPPDPYKIR